MPFVICALTLRHSLKETNEDTRQLDHRFCHCYPLVCDVTRKAKRQNLFTFSESIKYGVLIILWKIENCEISKSLYNNYQGIYCSSNVAKDVETWEVFSYPINIFVIVSRCKYNLVEKIFATHIIKM
jgi:hypothetical protein